MTNLTGIKPEDRAANIDLLRSSAILLVLCHHFVIMWPHQPPQGLAWITSLGSYGVDLFFVISGWLIGGLLWKEQKWHGNVQLPRFIARRLLRTAPPYFAALVLSFTAVRLGSPSPPSFDWHYLCFLQNYHVVIPYFDVSWSLCVEEHFYLVFPLATVVLLALGARSWFKFAALLTLAPLVGRLCNMDQAQHFFGYYRTASHLRAEGLILGVWASYLFVHESVMWEQLRRLGRYAAWPLVIVAALLLLYFSGWGYSVGIFLLSWGFVLLTVIAASSPGWRLAKSPINYSIAISSYSTYLVHALAIHAAKLVAAKLGIQNDFAVGSIIFLFVAMVAATFFLLVESQALRLRDALVPRRSRV